jgi:hypothetical protein
VVGDMRLEWFKQRWLTRFMKERKKAEEEWEIIGRCRE